jgi:hypothetical protein
MSAHRLTGLPNGQLDTETKEITFELAVTDRPPISFTMTYGPAAQIIGALGRMFLELQKVLWAEKGMQTAGGESVAVSHIQKDRWQNVVVLQLTTPAGVPYTFVLTPQDAADIGDQLKTESAKPHQVGTA